MKFQHSLSLIAFALLTLPAAATDWYVDAVNGSNANGGKSPGDAWRTITHAVANTPLSGQQTIHIGPGDYTSAIGEVFPIQMRPDMQLVGAPGGPKPRLSTTATSQAPFGRLIEIRSDYGSQLNFGPQTLVQGLHLSGGNYQVEVFSASGDMNPTLRDIELADAYTGIVISIQPPVSSHILLERIVKKSPAMMQLGVSAQAWQQSSAPQNVSLQLVMRDCDIAHMNTCVFAYGAVDLQIDRCRFTDALENCIEFRKVMWLTSGVTLLNSEVGYSNNYGLVVDGLAHYLQPWLELTIRGCTFAANGYTGVAVNSAVVPGTLIAIDRSIFVNDTFDLLLPASSQVTNSLISHGEFTGANGNFAADPLFVDYAQRDWRLRWGSPCIDLIADAAVAQQLDVEGEPRGIDGNLDRVERTDIGAYEFRPLDLQGSSQLGAQMRLEAWGPQGNASVVYWTRVGPVAPFATPFGEFDLDPDLARVFRTVTVGASSPSAIVRQIPNNPLLAGQTFAFQALTDNAAAPLGKAFTNVAVLTLIP